MVDHPPGISVAERQSCVVRSRSDRDSVWVVHGTVELLIRRFRPFDPAVRQSHLQLGDARGSGFGAAEVEGFEVRQAGEMLDPDIAECAARQRQPIDLRQLGQVRGQQITKRRTAERQVNQLRLCRQCLQADAANVIAVENQTLQRWQYCEIDEPGFAHSDVCER